MDALLQAIGTYGFPIVVALLCMYYVKYQNDKHTEQIAELNLQHKTEIYMCTSNRSAGKTTFFGRWMVKRFKNYGEKFMLIYRFVYELDDCADKFFKDIGKLFFPDSVMVNRRKAQGTFHELILDDVPCGYAVSLNSSDQLKKYSHLFDDTTRMLFDEFQSETNKYCPDELRKFISVHTSVARGNGEKVRYVPVYMLSNPVSIINPYYTEMGISSRLKEDTRFLKGDGYVLEQGFLESASIAQKNSGFNRAFKDNSYVAYSAECIYLNDNKSFIERPKTEGRYIATLKYEGKTYGIREYANDGFLYCDDRPDNTFATKITVTTEDHEINYVMLKRNDCFLANLRFFFEKGCFRFKDLKCKEAVLKALSY